MPVRCLLKCEKPDEIEYTLMITMSAKEWNQLRDQMSGNHWRFPTHVLVDAINDLLEQARKIYHPHPKVGPTDGTA